MGLQRYASSRVRFTWRNRCVTKSAPRTSQKVLVYCKDQRAFGGKCSYFSVCAALEAHKRLKTDEPCPELSWTDLEEKSLALKNVDKLSRRVGRCFVVLKSTGVRYEGSEDILKIEDFERIITGNKHTVDEAIRKYLKEGPMVGSFAVYATTFDDYGQSEFPDEICSEGDPHRPGLVACCLSHRIWRTRLHPFLGVPKLLWTTMAWSCKRIWSDICCASTMFVRI